MPTPSTQQHRRRARTPATSSGRGRGSRASHEGQRSGHMQARPAELLSGHHGTRVQPSEQAASGTRRASMPGHVCAGFRGTVHQRPACTGAHSHPACMSPEQGAA